MKKNIMGLISVVLFSTFPCLLIYFENVKGANFVDVFSVMFFYVSIAIFILFIFSRVFKVFSKAIIMTNIIMGILCNYELVANLFKNSSYQYLCTSLLAVLVVGILCVFLRKAKEEFIIELNDVFCMVIAGLILVNGVPLVPTIIHKVSVTVQKEDELELLHAKKVANEDASNVYYMIFDEYGGFENLEQLFGYDNADFLDFLYNRKFNISENSYNMESISTWTVLPNLLNLNYVVDDTMGEIEKQRYLEIPTIYHTMDSLGYDINTCAPEDKLSSNMSQSFFRAKTRFEETIGYYVLKRSVFVHLYDVSFRDERDMYAIYREELVDSMEFFMNLSDMATQSTKPQFCLGFFSAPHMPFVFREDGTPADPVSTWNADDYLSYLKWTNVKIEEMVDYILLNDPTAIIIIQSDHGARFLYHKTLEGEEVDNSKEIYQHNILNCVYYKGEEIDIEGESGINTLRKLLNKEFSMELDMVQYVSKE